MAYVSLYRKYRPETFDAMIGQEHIVRTLKNQIMSGNIGHAYLFTGTRGTGKTSAAKIFARAVNCLEPKDGSPCGVCRVCRELSAPACLDVLEIDAASNNGVDEIRDIRDKVKYPPTYGKYKVYIIDEVHMLTPGAFNALLKTLEEPPQHALFILATTEVHKLPLTILSRCMRFDFKLVPTADIAKLITGIFRDINKESDAEAVEAIARAGEGSVRDALSLADMCVSYRKGKLTYQDVQEITGASSPELIMSLASAVLDSRMDLIFAVTADCAAMGRNFTVIARDLTGLLTNLIYIKNSVKAEELLKLPKDVFEPLKAIALKYDSVRLLNVLEVASKLEGAMRYSTQPRIVFETALLRAAITGNEIDAGLIARLKALEDKMQTVESMSVNQPKAVISPQPPVISRENTEIQAAKPVDVHKPAKVENPAPAHDAKAAPASTIVKEQQSKPAEVKAEIKVSSVPEPIAPAIEDTETAPVSLEELGLKPSGESVVFGAVTRVYKGADTAKEIMGKVLGGLRKRGKHHIVGIFGYNQVNMRIEAGKFIIEAPDDYSFRELTEADNNSVLKQELIQYAAGAFDRLEILPPKSGADARKSLDLIKQLFDKDITTIKE